MDSKKRGAEKRDRYTGVARMPIRIHKTDGSNRTYEAIPTGTNGDGITVRVSAVFAVGEVVELSPTDDHSPGRPRARVLYRNSDQYGLFLLAADEQIAFQNERSA
jgi:hypothetical protein